jgi:cyclophilin family peptidyl-prolyl cis-trans isomerase/HEAT repeat protein
MSRLSLLALVLFVGCREPERPPLPASGNESPRPAPSASDPEISAWADARQAGPLAELARAGDAATRRRALWALARVHDAEATAALLHGLRDPDPEARRAAAFGLGALEGEAPPEAVTALLGAYAAESSGWAAPDAGPPEVVRGLRATQLWSLARTADPRVVPALIQGLDGPEEHRIAVCRGLAYGQPEGWPEALLRAALARASHDPDAAVREACWQGLGRTPVEGALAVEVQVLAAEALAAEALAAEARPGAATTAASTPTVAAPAGALAPRGAAPAGEAEGTGQATETELRVQLARFLGRAPQTEASWSALAEAAAAAEPRVAIAALRSLGPAGGGREPQLAALLDRVVARWWPAAAGEPERGTSPLDGPGVHVLLTAIEIARPHARAEPIHARAASWASRCEALPASREAAWLGCRLAQLVDLGRGWPARVERCGAPILDDDTRRILAAEILGEVTGAEELRSTLLQRHFSEGGPRVREAVLAAAARLSSERALWFVRAGLGSEDEGVLLATLELLRGLVPGAKRARDAQAVDATLRGEPASPQRVFAELDPELLSAGRRLLSTNLLEARVTLAETLEALADPGLPPATGPLEALLEPLSRHPSHAVRTRSRAALRALGREATDLEAAGVLPVAEPLAPAALAALPRRATLRTERGEVVIELHAVRSPATVARFAELARAGFFDGLVFHRVVPGFVAQGGDPRGDGYGGPAWWQRCEDSPLAYERGVVGMALAGRDTGGSQFFITLGPQHHLDGRYTVFGRVVEGMALVDALQVGDPILGVAVE